MNIGKEDWEEEGRRGRIGGKEGMGMNSIIYNILIEYK
jgi:hypothetical protein